MVSRAALLLLGAMVAVGCANPHREGRDAASNPGPAPSAPAQAGPESSAVLIISSDLWGYLAPCGCSQNMRGGIARAAAQVADVRNQGAPVLYLDGGDALFGHHLLSPAMVPQEELKARALSDALKAMGLAAHSEGELDLVRGAAFARSLGLPTLEDGIAKLFPVGRHTVAVVAAHDPGALAAAAAKARAGGAAFVVGLLHQTLSQIQQAAPSVDFGADLVIATHVDGEFGAEENRVVAGKPPLVQLQSKGRSMLRVDLSFLGTRPFSVVRTQSDVDRELAALDERIALTNKQINQPGLRKDTQALYQGKAAELVKRRAAIASAPLQTPGGQNTFGLRFIALESSLPEEPKVAAIVKRYDAEVGELNLAWAREHGQDCPAPQKGRAAYVGSAECKSCHAEAYAFWETTKHSHAYPTLVEVGKQNHLDCIGCHVTGIDAPGGVCRLDKVKGRENVGCEMCHGPGSLHAEDPSAKNIRVQPAKEQCIGCHNPENSPHFDFATYLPQILGKGHGRT